MTLLAVNLGGRAVRLDDRDLVGEGGEGRVYRHGASLAVKVFSTPSAARAAKLRAFPTALPAEVIAPLELATDSAGGVVGYSMRLLDGAVDLARFSQRRWRAGRVSNADVLGTMRVLAKAVARLHQANVVVGDLNDGNVVLTANTTPWLIDADSMHLPAHPCTVAHERFLDPRFYGVDLAQKAIFSRQTDWYALAVLAFASLLYVHPFGGAHPAHPTLLRRAEARVSALRSDVKLPGFAARPDTLPDDALAFFERVFEKDAREPLPPAVLDAHFTACPCGAEHARARCPACAIRANVTPVVRLAGKLKATRVFYKQNARVVAATYDGTLRWLAEEGGALRREDETFVAPAGPLDLVRLAGNATWLGVGKMLKKIVAGQVVESRSVQTVHGDIAADGDVFVLGDTLVREDATRIGQILEGQTHVRVGDALGFAFYRAGGLTVAFVFDPRRGPLRQIEGFPALVGRLDGWSAVFDHASPSNGSRGFGEAETRDDHVLVTFALEANGRVRHVAHVIDARGRILASDDGAALPPSLTGRALGPNGTVLAASDSGLLLLRPDGKELVTARLFPEAKDFVSPADELLVGTGGSLYSVTDDEITHLCFTV